MLQTAEVVNPDVLTQQRRRNDKGRQWTLIQTEDWTQDTIQALYEWVSNKHADLEIQICRLQAKHDRLAFQIFELEECVYGLNERKADRQTNPLKEGHKTPELPALKSLKRKWHKMDDEMRLLRHMQRLLGPLYYLSNIHSMQLPLSDPLLMACWELTIAERPWLERREGGK